MGNVLKLPTWSERKTAGDRHEDRVHDELTVRDWVVDLLGQGAMSPAVTAVLGRSKSPLRYLPEFLAVRRGEMCLIDCKGRISPHTGRHSLSRDAVRAHLRMRDLFEIPVFYVFETMGVMTPFDVMRLADCRVGSRGGGGGAYFLVPSAEARPFDAFFGEQQALFAANAA